MTETIEFADWLAICNLKAAYCRLLDAKDWDNWKQLFTEDCVVDTRPSGGELVEGREQYVSLIERLLAGSQTAHQVHSPQMTLEDGRAHVVWAMQDRVIKAEFGLTGYGHYHDIYVRTPDGWKIASLTLTRLIVDMDSRAG